MFKFLLRCLIFIALFVFGLLIWGVVIEPRFVDVETHRAAIPNLPAEWEGQRVGVIADLQVGMWLANTDTIGRAVAKLVEARPAVVLLAGDFVYGSDNDMHEEIATVNNLLRPLLQAGIPTYAVLGNHDYKIPSAKDFPTRDVTRADQLLTALESIGVQVLNNDARRLTLSGSMTQTENSSLYVVGIGSYVAKESQPRVALSKVPETAARIIFMHHPNSFAEVPANAAPFAVAGHTHGGQMRIPFTPDWSWLTFLREDDVHVDGWIQNYGQPGNQLYINRGIGFSVVPIRINCPPEVSLFTLSRK